jgi:hypothetical protein
VAGFAGHGLKDLWQHRSTLSPTPAGGRRSAWSSIAFLPLPGRCVLLVAHHGKAGPIHCPEPVA